MSVVLVTGGTGTLGRRLVTAVTARGHEVRVLSRRPGRGTHIGDLATGAGVAAAADGAELVVHAASDRRLGRSDLAQTGHLLSAAANCRHLLYISIVGVDEIPFGYYRAKLACEQLITAAPVASTILRATQFHELLGQVLRAVERWPVAALPLDLRFQSVVANEVATRAADLVEAPPVGRAGDFGGPQVLSGREIVDIWREHRGRPRAVISLRWPGRVYRAFADGHNTCPQHADGRKNWSDFVREAQLRP
jgi:uncharacterized protein YbjT (DUF2867 family)